MVNRILRDDPSKGDMHNRQGLSLRMLWECFSDYHMWPIYMIGVTWTIPTQPMSAYLTLQLRSLGFTTFETNLLTVSRPTTVHNLCANLHGRYPPMFSSFSSSSSGPGSPNASANASSSD
jgi:hypothetical protein